LAAATAPTAMQVNDYIGAAFAAVFASHFCSVQWAYANIA